MPVTVLEAENRVVNKRQKSLPSCNLYSTGCGVHGTGIGNKPTIK